MARLWSAGFELQSVATGVEFDSTTGTAPSISTSTGVRSGAAAIRFNTTTARSYLSHQFIASSSAKFILRFYLWIASLPTSVSGSVAANETEIAAFGPAGDYSCNLTLSTTGALRLRDFDDVAQIGPSTALNTGQFYRVEVVHQDTGGNLELLVDGVSVGSVTGKNLNAVIGISLGLGANRFATSTCTGDIYMDDVAVNDTTGSFQNTYPGSGKIIHLKPDATGDINGYLVVNGGTAGAANNFTRVNETTPDDGTTYNASVLSSAEDLYNNSASGIGASDIVNVVSVGGRFADLVAADATTAFKFEVEKTGSGTKTQSAAIVANSTTWKTNATAAPVVYPITTYQDPDSAAWTKTTLDSMQIGMIVTAAGVRTAAISTIWALVDYTPVIASSTNPSKRMMRGIGQ